MEPVLTAAQMAELDSYTIETIGLHGQILMSNAAREVLRFIRERFANVRRLLIFAGVGNNGGDGVALAYYAQQAGLNPTLALCHPQLSDPPALSLDSSYFLGCCEKAYTPVNLLANPVRAMELVNESGAELVVDALFGTGLDRPLGEYYLAVIERINNAGLPILSIDCPSGLNCTSGAVMGDAVRASATVSFGYAKRGFYHPAAKDYLGETTIAALGFASLADAGVGAEAHAWPNACWEPLRQPRRRNTHKGDYGKLLIVAGHRRYTGAPRLAARAALRAGAGLVRLVVPGPIHAICCDDPAVMVAGHACDGHGGFNAEPGEELLQYIDWADALVIGPGLSDAPDAVRFVQTVLAQRDLPVVVDADGLRALWHITQGSPGSELLWDSRAWPLVLTPHVGELAHLAGITPEEALEHWFEVSTLVASQLNGLVLAKSCQCVIALPTGGMLFPRAGHAALAVGGTGDVLSGILGALLARYHATAQTKPAGQAANAALRQLHAAEIAATAVNIHACAAELAAGKLGENAVTPVDLIEYLPAGLARLLETGAR